MKERRFVSTSRFFVITTRSLGRAGNTSASVGMFRAIAWFFVFPELKLPLRLPHSESLGGPGRIVGRPSPLMTGTWIAFVKSEYEHLEDGCLLRRFRCGVW